MTLQLSVAQLNFTVGDMMGNARKIIDAARNSYQQGARLLVTPELSICGYAAEDLFLRPSFIKACQESITVYPIFIITPHQVTDKNKFKSQNIY
jgi:NAD+ synthase (glutamine-hydrolysing)